jgi:anti-sigma regulatory factor (Ser/Thr protein kinase)
MSEITVPENIVDKGLNNFFQGWHWLNNPTAPINVNFQGCNFIAPYGATLFATYILWLKEIKRHKVKLLYKKTSSAGNSLLQCGFFELLGENNSSPTEARDDRTVKLTRIQTNSEIPIFASSVMNILNIEDEELAGAVKYSLIELLRNVVQHSQSKVGGIAMAQYYPTTGLVEVCVADTGVGIKATINEAYPEIDNNLYINERQCRTRIIFYQANCIIIRRKFFSWIKRLTH